MDGGGKELGDQRGDRGGGSSSRCWSMEDEQWKRKGKEEVKIDACLFFTLYLVQALTVPRPSSFIVSPNLISLFVFSWDPGL